MSSMGLTNRIPEAAGQQWADGKVDLGVHEKT